MICLFLYLLGVNIDLDGGVATAVEDLSGEDLLDRHVVNEGWCAATDVRKNNQ